MKTPRFFLLYTAAAALAPANALAQTTLETAISHLQYREIGPALMGGRIAGPRRGRVEAAGLLHWHRDRRRLEDREPRHLVDAPLRRPADEFHRRHHPRPVQPEPGLGRHRRAAEPPVIRLGQRRLQVHRRRKHLAAHGAGGDEAHRAHPDPPAQPGRGVRRCGGRPVGPERGTRRLPHQGRRRDLGEGPLHRRAHRRDRPRHGPGRPQHDFRGDVPAPTHGVGLQRGRTRERPLPHLRRRRQLDRTRRGASRGRQGPHRRRRLPPGRQRGLRAHRGGCAHAGTRPRRWWRRRRSAKERPLPLPRPRRHLGEDVQHQSPPHVLLAGPHRPEQPGPHLRPGDLAHGFRRRRRHLPQRRRAADSR